MAAWIDAELRERAGPLVPAALSFGAQLGVAHVPRAAEGLVALTRALVAFARDPAADEEADRRFVEGAGALLGLLLLDSFRAGRVRSERGQHLVQLSAHGFFDPFHAVDAALSAESVRAELAEHVGEAEREARGDGPVARVASRFVARLAELRPELRVVDQFACALWLAMPDGERVHIDLAPTVRATRDAPLSSVRHAVDKLVAMLPGGGAIEGGLEHVRARLFPRVTSRHSLDELSARASAKLAGHALAGELVTAIVVEEGGRARYVREDELTGWRISVAEALALATDNLARASARTRVLREDTADGPIFMLRSGDGRDSARLLLPELRAPLEAQVGSVAAVAVPHRDVLLACDARSEALLRQLRARTEADAARAPHRVSAELYVLSADGLHPLSAQPK
jgi:Protein of unknown function (DUF1444)